MAHVFDLATHLPSPFVVMMGERWLGINALKESGLIGPNIGYGLWEVGAARSTWYPADPVTYPAIGYLTHDPSLCQGGYRHIASKLRPLAGIYSCSGKNVLTLADDTESKAHMTLDQSVLRTGADPRARCDVWACGVSHLHGTAADLTGPFDPGYKSTNDIRWHGLKSMLEVAVADSRTNCITAWYEPESIWTSHPEYDTTTKKMLAMQSDLELISTTLLASAASLQVDGRLLIFIYSASAVALSDAQWSTILEAVRTTTGDDSFFVVRSKTGDAMAYADGVYAWVGYTDYAAAAGTGQTKAKNWRLALEGAILDELPTYPGRVVLGGITPGFTDWGKTWGDGNAREIPRSAETIAGQFDAYDQLATGGQTLDGFVCHTWDDYVEGSVWEPTVQDPGDLLGTLTETLADWYSETVTPAETTALKAIWTNYTVARPCTPRTPAAGISVVQRQKRRSVLGTASSRSTLGTKA